MVWKNRIFEKSLEELGWISMEIRKFRGAMSDFIFLGSKITADGDCSHEIKKRLLLGKKL